MNTNKQLNADKPVRLLGGCYNAVKAGSDCYSITMWIGYHSTLISTRGICDHYRKKNYGLCNSLY